MQRPLRHHCMWLQVLLFVLFPKVPVLVLGYVQHLTTTSTQLLAGLLSVCCGGPIVVRCTTPLPVGLRNCSRQSTIQFPAAPVVERSSFRWPSNNCSSVSTLASVISSSEPSSWCRTSAPSKHVSLEGGGGLESGIHQPAISVVFPPNLIATFNHATSFSSHGVINSVLKW